jgi:hypothetical protein
MAFLLRYWEKGENGHSLTLIFSHPGEAPFPALTPKGFEETIIQKGKLHAGGFETLGEGSIPETLGEPHPPGTFTENFPDTGREMLDLAEPVGVANHGQNREKKTASENFHLLAFDHFQEHSDVFRVFFIDPFQEGTAKKKGLF